MNGGEIFNFTLRAVPEAIGRLLETMRLRLEDIDLIVFHQANRYMLDYLRKKLKISDERLVVTMVHVGMEILDSSLRS